MQTLVQGLHHITALASDPQKNLNFYAGILGLKLVKKTINFDAPEVYHLYYGNETGSPGTLITFFPYGDIPRGRKGKGQLTVTSFSISENAIDYWIKRLRKFHIACQPPQQRFEETIIYFEDHDGLGLELVANAKDMRKGITTGNIPEEYAIRGIYGVTLSEECDARSTSLLVGQMDHTLISEKGNRLRYAVDDLPGSFVDILCNPDTLMGLPGCGTVHHVAFTTENDATQLEARAKLSEFGLNVTSVLDREYFHSIYFREPGGVLFELATKPPGFTVDEQQTHLGEALKLPPWHEKNRTIIEKNLTPIKLDLARYAD
jgi:glyoxalase family protein